MAPPANDDFADAEVLSTAPSGTVSGDLTEATMEVDEPVNFRDGDPTVWYKLTPTESRLYRWRVLADSGARKWGDVVVGTSVTDLTWVYGGWAEFWGDYNVPMDAGTTYYVRVTQDLNDLPGGAYTLEWDSILAPQPPANDDWEDAQLLTGFAGEVEGTLENATSTGGEPLYEGYDTLDTVWYRFVPPTTGVYEYMAFGGWTGPFLDYPSGYPIDAWEGTVLDELLSVPRVADNTAGDFSRMYQLQAGTTYYIRVGTNPASSHGTFTLRWQGHARPANDDWEDAHVLSGTSGSVLCRDILAATGQPPDDPDFQQFPPRSGWYGLSDRTVWYAYTPAATGMLRCRAFSWADDPFAEWMPGWNAALITYHRGSSLSTLEHLGGEAFPSGTRQYELSVGARMLIAEADLAVEAGQTYWICLSDYGELPNVGMELTWKFTPATVWDGVWGTMPAFVPEPPGAEQPALVDMFASWWGQPLPTEPGPGGVRWAADISNDYDPIVTAEGLQFLIDPPPTSLYTAIYYTPSEGAGPQALVYHPNVPMSFEIGFIVRGLRWLGSSNDSGAGGHWEWIMNNNGDFFSGRMGWSIQVYERQPQCFIWLPGTNGWADWMQIADGWHYRIRYEYDPDADDGFGTVGRWSASLSADGGTTWDLAATSYFNVGAATAREEWRAPYFYADNANLDGTGWSAVLEGWVPAPYIDPGEFPAPATVPASPIAYDVHVQHRR
jgi:hypothetical protein